MAKSKEDEAYEFMSKRCDFMMKYKSLQGDVQTIEIPKVTAIIDDYCYGRYSELDAVNEILKVLVTGHNQLLDALVSQKNTYKEKLQVMADNL